MNLNRHNGSKRKRRTCKRRRDEFEEDLSINGIRKGKQWAGTVGNGEAKVHNGL
jgi:hypothetical protein